LRLGGGGLVTLLRYERCQYTGSHHVCDGLSEAYLHMAAAAEALVRRRSLLRSPASDIPAAVVRSSASRPCLSRRLPVDVVSATS
jgi:hypothetical protein